MISTAEAHLNVVSSNSSNSRHVMAPYKLYCDYYHYSVDGFTTPSQRLVVGRSPLQVRWNETRFHTRSGTLLGVPTASDRLWKLVFPQHSWDE